MLSNISVDSSGIFATIVFLAILQDFVYDLVKTPFVASLKYLEEQQTKAWRSFLGSVRSLKVVLATCAPHFFHFCVEYCSMLRQKGLWQYVYILSNTS